MKRTHLLYALLMLAALVALPAWAITVLTVEGDFMSNQVGVRLGSPRVTLEEGQTITATVALPAVLARQGLKATKEGEAVQITFLGNNRLKLMHVPSGQSIEITYRPKK